MRGKGLPEQPSREMSRAGYVVEATEEGQKTRDDPCDPHTRMDALSCGCLLFGL